MAQKASDATTMTLPSDREILITREFNAPRALVWEAITKPEHLKNWWGPRGYELISCELDARPGGSWRFVQRGPDGNDYGFRGEIREFAPPERMVQTFEFEGMPGHISVETLTLEERNGKTLWTAHSMFASPEDRDGMLQSGMEGGMRETMDRLAELLEAQRRAA